MDVTANWTRDTKWRQGCVLPAAACHALGLLHHATPESTCVVVIGHDCDVAHPDAAAEPDVEVIVGRWLPRGDGNFYWAKAPRTLHLDFRWHGVSRVVELGATAKEKIPKHALGRFVPDDTYELDAASLEILRSWLAARYQRAAFPDRFVALLSGSKLDRRLTKLMAPVGACVTCVYFDVSPATEISAESRQPYLLRMVLAYAAGQDPEAVLSRMEVLEDAVETLFADSYFNAATERWTGIELLGCVVISEDDLTVAQARKLTPWRLEHLTLRDAAAGVVH